MFGRSIDLRFCCSNAASDTSASHIEQVGVPTRKLIHPSSTFPLSCNAIWRDYCQTSSDTAWRFVPVKVSGSKALWGHVMAALGFASTSAGASAALRRNQFWSLECKVSKLLEFKPKRFIFCVPRKHPTMIPCLGNVEFPHQSKEHLEKHVT